jgi:hypothetical protein
MSQGGGCGLFIGSFILGLEGAGIKIKSRRGEGGSHLQQLRSVRVDSRKDCALRLCK